MNWTTPQDLLAQLQRRWDKGELLASLLAPTPLFPLRLKLKTPNSRELSAQFDAVRRWINDLQQMPSIRIEYKSIQHRVLGQNELPARVWIDSLDDACRLLRKQNEYRQFEALLRITHQRHPQLSPWLARYPLRALQQVDDWPRLLDIIDWFQQHPHSALFLRQIDLPGIHSKFIEQHRALLTPLLDLSLPADAIDQNANGLRGFARRYGLRDKPQRLRFRLLDPTQRLLNGASQDIALTIGAIDALDQQGWIARHIDHVFITENEINFLTFPESPRSLLLFGAGYGFEPWRDIGWLLNHPAIHYWGDIDTHGFAILDQLRALLPQVQSLLMDRPTLLHHRDFWGHEDKPETRQLTRLTPQENRLYQDLTDNRLGSQLRLEQERIGFGYLRDKLRQI